ALDHARDSLAPALRHAPHRVLNVGATLPSVRPVLQRHRCRACGSDLLDMLASGEQAWECGACGLAGGRDLVAVRWRRWAEEPPMDDQHVRWRSAINSLRRAQMLLLMLRWGCDRYRDDPRVFGIRLSILVWSSK